MNRPSLPPRMYGTLEAAKILGVLPWRVKNFSASPYGVEPSKKGAGRGKRSSYRFEELLRLSVANALYGDGTRFTPDGITPAIPLITDDLVHRWSNSYRSDGTAPPIVLTFDGSKWRVRDSKESAKAFSESLEDGDVWFSLNLVPLWEGVVRSINDLEADGEI